MATRNATETKPAVTTTNEASVVKETANFLLVELEPPFVGKVYVPKDDPILAQLGADDDWPATIKVNFSL